MNLKSQFLTVAKQRIKDGRCTKCGALQPEARRGKWECKACAGRYKTKSKKWHEHDGPQKKNPHAGVVACLRCDKDFRSPDKRRIRLCEQCHAAAGHLMKGLGCEEAIYVA